MKNIFTILLAFLYLALSSGMAMEIHRCMNKISDVSFIPTGSQKCGKCGMPKSDNNCCKDEIKFIRLTETGKLISIDYRLAVSELTLHNIDYLFPDHSFGDSFKPLRIASAPAHPPVSLFKLHGVLRI